MNEANVAISISALDVAKSDSVKVGDPLYVIGTPEGLERTLTQGILSGRRSADGIEHLQLSAAVSPGSSGSPVLNNRGEVVGIVVGYLSEGQQLNFAVSMKSVKRLLQPGVPLKDVLIK